MVAKKLISRSDISDWRDDMLREEVKIETEQDLIDHLLVYNSLRVGQWAVVAKNTGQLKEDFWSEDKQVLSTGSSVHARAHIAACKREAKLKNGRRVVLREYIGQVPVRPSVVEDAPEETPGVKKVALEFSVPIAHEKPEPPYVETGTDAALERMQRRVRTDIPGRLWNCFVQIAAIDPELVRDEIDFIQDKLDEFLEKLTQPIE